MANSRYDIHEVVAEAEGSLVALERRQAERPPSLNVNGFVFEVDSDGVPVDAGMRDKLAAMAQAEADRIVARGIKAHNRTVHPLERVDMRDASLAEVEHVWKAMLEGGKYRSETGNSPDPVDLGDVVARELG